jgi:hypothetical protein
VDAPSDPFKIRDNLLAYRDGRFKVRDHPNQAWREPNDLERAQAAQWATVRLDQLDREQR